MKKVLFSLAALLISTSAHAVHSGSSWSQIFADRDAVVTHGYAIMGIKLENACMTDTEIRSIEPTTQCAELAPRTVYAPGGEGGGPYTEWDCVRYETKIVSVPRTYERPECLRLEGGGERSPECVEFGTVTVTVPRTIDTQVYVTRGEAGQSFSKPFTFPSCPVVYPR
ncbi:hypothetical protein [Bdellovibrio sp. BCCA]|uniref:hypothetical protein n=1 Tax=Bdellovibrio sp. BCCA TaxID=3136281 RepID=UPI0030F0FE31